MKEIELIGKLRDGHVICCDVKHVSSWLSIRKQAPSLIVADPPYGRILNEPWDYADLDLWVNLVRDLSCFDVPIYWWGGIGKPNNRSFFEFILRVERETELRMFNLITWKKVRAYGKSNDYLFCREECAIFTVGGAPPKVFNIPLLDEKRGYPGYNAKYPAKSEFLRRSNVWCETEILRGKVHSAQKAPRVCQIPIEVHTKEGDLVLDLFAGSGETSVQAKMLGRKFLAVEIDRQEATKISKRLLGIHG